jgi:hypothetical protein
MPYVHSRQNFVEKCGRQVPVKITIEKMIKKEHSETCRKMHWNERASLPTLTVNSV